MGFRGGSALGANILGLSKSQNSNQGGAVVIRPGFYGAGTGTHMGPCLVMRIGGLGSL